MDIIALDRILSEVAAERERQERLKASGKFTHTCADLEASVGYKTIVLGEEFGEVCRAAHDGKPDQLREELIQVAAVAVAWVQALDKKKALEECEY